jgi:preprotein translocase subunit SecG
LADEELLAVMTLALNSVLTNLMVVGFLIVCVLMILIVLIQRPQGGGLGGAFGAGGGGGGAGAGQTAFGTKTGDVLTWGTVTIFFIYLCVAVALNFAARPSTEGAPIQPVLINPATQGDQPEPEDVEPAPGVDSDPTADPAIEPQSDPVFEPAGDPVGDPAGDSVGDSVGEPMGEPDPVDPASAEAPA